jgi:hypothetical protein
MPGALGAVLFLSVSAAEAAPVCMTKASDDAAKLSIGMGPSDAAAFTAAGWTPLDCPPAEIRIFGGADKLCARFNGYRSEQKAVFLRRYGVTTEQLCQAAQNYETEQTRE